MLRRILSIVLILGTVLCTGCNNGTNKISNDVKNGAKEIGEGVENTAESANDAVSNGANDLKFTAVRFKDDFINAGYDLKESVENKFGRFKGNETDYNLGNDIVRVYEYNSKEELDADIKRISPDGLTINGVKEYEKKPYYYTKDNALIVYEGNDDTYISELNNKYGNPII